MVRLRNVVMVFVLATGLAGSRLPTGSPVPSHCDSCDDFPMPAYGPNFSMMPGSYTGPPTPGLSGSGRSDGATPPWNARCRDTCGGPDHACGSPDHASLTPESLT